MENITIKSGSKIIAQFEVRPYSPKASAVYGSGVAKVLPLFNGLKVSLNANLKYNDGNSPAGFAAGLIFPKRLYKKVIKILTSGKTATLFKTTKSLEDYSEIPVRRPQFQFDDKEVIRQEEYQTRIF